MKQIEKDKLCYYCTGCNKLEIEQYDGVRNCKNFMPSREDWQEKWKEALKNGNK